MCAVVAGREKNVELLLKAGADVNLENENKETVLHMTRSRICPFSQLPDHTELLNLIIDKIDNINQQVECF